jgi:hypothetical protein
MVALALCAGAFSFLTGATLLLALPEVEGNERERLFQLNTILGAATVFLVFGTFLVYQAASSLGATGSTPMSRRVPWYLLLAFPAFVAAGQWLVLNPGAAPWLFPFVNIGMVAIPSVVVATWVAQRYGARNPTSWPISWREWTSAFCYGAIGAVLVAALLNTGYLFVGARVVLSANDIDVGWDIVRGLRQLPRTTGILFDLSVLSLAAPLNEEFLKGSIVALFWWRRGSAARCFTWGVLAGAGFNFSETFSNSLAIVDSDILASQEQAGQWWIFGIARAGTAVMHSVAAGFAALAFYGLFKRRWLLVPGYPIAVLLHANWNAAVYLIAGDAILSQAAPSSTTLDVLGIGVLISLSILCATLLWVMSGQLRDEVPATIYRILGMQPAGRATAPDVSTWLEDRMKPVRYGPA